MPVLQAIDPLVGERVSFEVTVRNGPQPQTLSIGAVMGNASFEPLVREILVRSPVIGMSVDGRTVDQILGGVPGFGQIGVIGLAAESTRRVRFVSQALVSGLIPAGADRAFTDVGVRLGHFQSNIGWTETIDETVIFDYLEVQRADGVEPPPPDEEPTGNAVLRPAMADQLVSLHNQVRLNEGLDALSLSSRLQQTAEAKAVDMANFQYFSHVSPRLGTPTEQFINRFGFRPTFGVAENIVRLGTVTSDAPQRMMDAFLTSPGHRANILSSAWELIGAAVAEDTDLRDLYGVVHFADQTAGG